MKILMIDRATRWDKFSFWSGSIPIIINLDKTTVVHLLPTLHVVNEKTDSWSNAESINEYRDDYEVDFIDSEDFNLLILHAGNIWAEEYFNYFHGKIPIILFSGNLGDYDWIPNPQDCVSCIPVEWDELKGNFIDFMNAWKENAFSNEKVPFDILKDCDKRRVRQLSDKLVGLSYLVQGALIINGYTCQRNGKWHKSGVRTNHNFEIDDLKTVKNLEKLNNCPKEWFKNCFEDMRYLYAGIKNPSDFKIKHITKLCKGSNITHVYNCLIDDNTKNIKWKPLLRIAKAVFECSSARSCKSCGGELKVIVKDPQSLMGAYENFNELLKVVEEICEQ